MQGEEEIKENQPLVVPPEVFALERHTLEMF